MNDLCPQCGDPLELVTENVPKPHYGAMVCRKCDVWQKWIAAPMTWEKARTYQMPFGKYRNQTIDQIGQRDREYLAWAAANLTKGSITRAIKCYLAGPTT